MAFQLKNVVPWGRNLSEYERMFNFSASDFDKQMISFGDGPASFNAEMTALGKKVVSVDPVYQFTKSQLAQRIAETKDEVLAQTQQNTTNFCWNKIKNIKELENIRMSAMTEFLNDFESGKAEGRYISKELPENLGFKNLSFDLGLSSHFLILYDQLGLVFHIESINEMLRICQEIRIFPLLNLNAERSAVIDGIVKYFESGYYLNIVKVVYEFQKGGNEMLVIRHF
jgi:serine/threonine protein kinase